jgi:hypothetical protein
MQVFKPECLNGEQSYGISNRNVLLPCCYVDIENLNANKVLSDLLEASNIDEHDSIDDIINQKEWKDFYAMLIKAKETNDLKILPRACLRSCLGEESVRIQNWQDLG